MLFKILNFIMRVLKNIFNYNIKKYILFKTITKYFQW